MRHVVVGIVVLIVLVICWRKFGFRKAAFGICLILLSIPGFSMTGMLLPSIFKLFGIKSLSMTARIVIGPLVVVVATITAKYIGWGKVLTGMYLTAAVISAFVILGFMMFVALAAASHGGL